MSDRDLMEMFLRIQEKSVEMHERAERVRERTMNGLTFKLRAGKVKSLLVSGKQSAQVALLQRQIELKEAIDMVPEKLDPIVENLDGRQVAYRPTPMGWEGAVRSPEASKEKLIEQLELACLNLQSKIDTIELLEGAVDDEKLIFDLQYEHVHFLASLTRNDDPNLHPTMYMSNYMPKGRYTVAPGAVRLRSVDATNVTPIKKATKKK